MSAIPRDILPIDSVAIHILNKLNNYYPDKLKERYNIDNVNNDDLSETYDLIGKRIGAIISGGEIDYDRVSNTILEDIKSERIKGITFDRL
jgi:ribosome biogenesis GTPase A